MEKKAARQLSGGLFFVTLCEIMLRMYKSVEFCAGAGGQVLGPEMAGFCHVPHVVAVTGKLVSLRLVSPTVTTGDVDCACRRALHEPIGTAKAVGDEDSKETLDILISGRGLKGTGGLPRYLTV